MFINPIHEQLIIIAIVGLIGNTAIAATFEQPRLTGLMWTIFEIITIAVIWGIFTIFTA